MRHIFHTSPHITMKIENIEARLRALSAQLAELGRPLRSEQASDGRWGVQWTTE